MRVLRYSDLHATDATGRQLPARLEFPSPYEGEGPGVRVVVDTTAAVYPIIIDPLTTSPNWTAESDQAGARFGFSVGTAGDVNGDGYADVIVGAPFYDNGQDNEGAVFVWYGSATGLGDNGTPSNAAWTAEGELGNADEHVLTGVLQPGQYYIHVINASGTGSTQPYHLQVVYE